MLPVQNIFDLISKDKKPLGQVHGREKYSTIRREKNSRKQKNEAKKCELHIDCNYSKRIHVGEVRGDPQKIKFSFSIILSKITYVFWTNM
jgi:hypothetical protein